MKLGSSRRRERKKRRSRLIIGFIKWSFFLGLILAAGIYAWYTGSSVAQRELVDLSAEVEKLDAEVSDLQQQLGESKGREAVLEDQLPSAAELDLLGVVRDRMEDGVTLDRLTGLVAAATAEQDCEGNLQSRRFRVRTPVGDASGSAASFADATLTLTAEGAAAVDSDGRPEAWFDKDRPIRITVQHVNGSESRAEGMLPLSHAMAVGDTEFRFQITAADMVGFAVATMDRCAYP